MYFSQDKPEVIVFGDEKKRIVFNKHLISFPSINVTSFISSNFLSINYLTCFVPNSVVG